MKNTFIVVSCFLVLLALIGCTRTAPVHNIEDQAIDYNLALSVVETAILKAGVETGWAMTVVKPGVIEASINIRVHKADIIISYSEKTYSINYKNSINLLYENGNIHKNYNMWVAALDQRIRINLIDARSK